MTFGTVGTVHGLARRKSEETVRDPGVVMTMSAIAEAAHDTRKTRKDAFAAR